MQYFTRFQLTARSRGPSATAGLLVLVGWVQRTGWRFCSDSAMLAVSIVKNYVHASCFMLLWLQANYGRWDAECVEKVKEIYRDLQLRKVFCDHERSSYESLLSTIDECCGAMPREMFRAVAQKLLKCQSVLWRRLKTEWENWYANDKSDQISFLVASPPYRAAYLVISITQSIA